MCEVNQTEEAGFLLLGFQNLNKFKILLFIVFLISYIVILSGNLNIIVLISIDNHLKIPMFYFVKHLAIADLMITTTIVPMMLEIMIKDTITISVTACFIQLHCSFIFGFVQCFLIVIMSYDRYLAICNPMHYNSIMQPNMCLQMVVGSWVIVACMSVELVLIYQFHFCGGNVIDHFFCDYVPLTGLSTSDTSHFVLIDFFLSILAVIVPFVFIIVTYVLIALTILPISSSNGRRKAFSTCSSHLATVCTYYGSLLIVYMTPSDDRSPNTNKFMSLFYIVATPLGNPIIYSLRNHKIRKSLTNVFKHFKKHF